MFGDDILRHECPLWLPKGSSSDVERALFHHQHVTQIESPLALEHAEGTDMALPARSGTALIACIVYYLLFTNYYALYLAQAVVARTWPGLRL